MEAIDLDGARKAVCAWLDEHQGGTLAQMAEDLKCWYPAHPDEMALILRGMMAAELRRRTRPESGSTSGNVSVSGDRAPRKAATDGLSPWGSAVTRLHQFQGEHPDVQFTSPVMGRYGQYAALIPPRTIPGESREITVTSPDLCGLMDELDDLFGSPAAPVGRSTPGSSPQEETLTIRRPNS